jgi:hypothetical protein
MGTCRRFVKVKMLPVWGEDASKVRAGTKTIELTRAVELSRDSRDSRGEGQQSEGKNLDHCE